MIINESKHRRLRNVLNLIFMLGAVAGLLLYFYSEKTVGTYVLFGAIGVKFVECAIRLIK